eukprot:1794758-Prymnesium_polylepis.1
MRSHETVNAAPPRPPRPPRKNRKRQKITVDANGYVRGRESRAWPKCKSEHARGTRAPHQTVTPHARQRRGHRRHTQHRPAAFSRFGDCTPHAQAQQPEPCAHRPARCMDRGATSCAARTAPHYTRTARHTHRTCIGFARSGHRGPAQSDKTKGGTRSRAAVFAVGATKSALPTGRR